ncbi:MAG: enolase C-terminal domain-like protein [Planctomycetaceae bacterium]
MDRGTLINVDVQVETRAKRRESGFGSMPTGALWAWPSKAVSADQAEQAMKQFAQDIVELANDYPDYAHPIDIVEQLWGEYEHQAKQIQQKHKLPEPLPILAQLVAASPLDAALHDAYGRVHGQNSYNLLSSTHMNYDLSEYLDGSFKGEYLDKYTLREPRASLPLYHLVGTLDPLTPGEVQKKIGDGLPETLAEWIKADGLTHLKIRLAGNDLKRGVDRVLAVERVAAETQAARGCKTWRYVLDFDEKCGDVSYVLDLLAQVKNSSAAAYDRVHYIEQPTSRDLSAGANGKVHEAAKLKPIVIDESLIDYDSLLLAREQGYTGIALKACKGHSESLLLGAAGQKLGMFLCVHDLTCPGFSFLHSASLAARIPGVDAVEGNGRQYCPSANRRWRAQYPTMFDLKDGSVKTGILNGIGLGF